jgi:hypothetical protein
MELRSEEIISPDHRAKLAAVVGRRSHNVVLTRRDVIGAAQKVSGTF